ncbi:MAG: type IV pilus twitching motility protein PilT [Candidatus Omnitrophica bacterium]|nr:type IV pilus twitching motility protein PilT [Candidatus Omnitrophota bacterium]MDD5573670.1 type IV pilus twitching motility protein PilT [Candidatus Omnitrophota bacterium]
MDIKDLLKHIVAKGASDLHLTPGLPPMMRLNGVLEKLEDQILESPQIQEMVEKILPENKRLVPGEEIDLGIEIRGMARFRVNVYYDRNGLCAAFRLIPALIRSLSELGVPEIVGKVSEMKRGLVLVTGVTGSGKSTTLAAIIDMINAKRRDHIITIEDPIEFVHHHKKCIVNQREVGMHTRSFSEALRGALREDPDVILVGEMRDLDTISMAMTAAETGHLVFGTLHTRGAAQTIDRVIDIFPPHQQEQIRTQLAESLEMVISQVLLPSMEGGRRQLACEVMVMTTAIRQLIRNKKTHLIATEIETGIQFGMQSMERSLKSLVDTGKVTQESALPWIHDKKIFENT